MTKPDENHDSHYDNCLEDDDDILGRSLNLLFEELNDLKSLMTSIE